MSFTSQKENCLVENHQTFLVRRKDFILRVYFHCVGLVTYGYVSRIGLINISIPL